MKGTIHMKKFKLIALFSCMLLILLSACYSNEKSSIKLAEVTRSLFYAPQYVALEKGFFEDEGLDVELQTTWGGDKTMTALLSDNADIALVGSETSIYVYEQNAKDYDGNFAKLTQTDGTFLIAKDTDHDFSWDIRSEKGVLEDEGLDVELQTTWGGDKTMTALLSDNADIALVGSETSIYVYEQNAKDYAVNFAKLTQTDGTFLVAKDPDPDFSWDN